MDASAGQFGPIDEFPENGLKEIELNGETLLLAKTADGIRALSGHCPHNGAPLKKGVRAGDKIICPWHKAAFSLGSGKCLAPPVIDDLQRYAVEVRDGLIHVQALPVPAPQRIQPDSTQSFAIIGAGAAGFSAAQTLRAEGFSGRIVMIDAPGRLPYDRTALSKTFLAKPEGAHPPTLRDEAFYDQQAIERQSGMVEVLDVEQRMIRLRGGTAQRFDAIFIATGGQAKTLDVPGADLAGIYTLRSADDAEAIKQAASSAKQVVIVGSSFIGMEVAAALRQRDIAVTVVSPEAVPFEAHLGREIGGVIQKLHESKGVVFKSGEEVAGFSGEKAVNLVRLKSGGHLPADLVILGLGTRPSTSFLDGAFTQKDGGVPVDSSLRLADGVFAGGDIAAFPLWGNGERVRVEHWRVAEQQGRIAALNMLQRPARFAQTPFFWTIQYGQRFDYAGLGRGDDRLSVRGDLQGDGFIAYYVRDGKVVAALGHQRDQEMAAIIELLDRRQDWSVEALHPQGQSPLQVLDKLLNA